MPYHILTYIFKVIIVQMEGHCSKMVRKINRIRNDIIMTTVSELFRNFISHF